MSYAPHTRVGGFNATHRYLVGLLEAGHDVTVIIGDRTNAYRIDGIRVESAKWVWKHFDRADLVISNHGDPGHLHRMAMHAGKPSVRFVHGVHDAFIFELTKHGIPSMVVFNARSLADTVGYDGPHMVCHPILRFDEYATTPGDEVTLVNLIGPKGVFVFDALARYMPARSFLGVKGGYGKQTDLYRPNITVIPQTARMRDDVYARTRILLMPSDYETWGLVGVEAMCSGIPVIAHPTPGLRESLGDAGIFCDRDDIDAWIDAIERLDDESEYDLASKRAKARAEVLAADDSLERFIAMIGDLS
jgi:glycosyltransferase involved in cell wall biosynthesis